MHSRVYVLNLFVFVGQLELGRQVVQLLLFLLFRKIVSQSAALPFFKAQFGSQGRCSYILRLELLVQSQLALV